MTTKKSTPDALMILGTSCPHCPGVLKILSHLIKSGELGQLHIINLEQHPEEAQKYGVRSVPWVRIGKHELHGAQTLEAMRQRIKWASEQATLKDEFDYLLAEAQVDIAIAKIKTNPDTFSTILDLLGDSETVLSTRIGIGVVMEEFEGTELLNKQLDAFALLANHKDVRVRADVCHYLSLTQNTEALSILKKHLDDPSKEVREVIADSIEDLELIKKS